MKKYEKELLAYRLRIGEKPHKNANILINPRELEYPNDVNIRMTYRQEDLIITQINKEEHNEKNIKK